MEEALKTINYSEGLSPYLSTFQEDLSNIEAIINLCTEEVKNKWDALFNAFNTFEFEDFQPVKRM